MPTVPPLRLMALFDACELGIASISVYEDQCPGAIIALRYWAEDRHHPVIERVVPIAHESFTAYRVRFGIHQIVVYGPGVLPPGRT